VTSDIYESAAKQTVDIVAKPRIRAALDLFFPIQPEPDFAGFGMTNPAGAGFLN